MGRIVVVLISAFAANLALAFSAVHTLSASPAHAQPDISWINQAADCATFSRGLSSLLEELEEYGDPEDESVNSALAKVIEEGCSGRFKICRLPICRTFKEPKTSRSRAIEKEPLAWLDDHLTCEQLTEQIRTRYAPLGGYASLPELKKRELGYILDTACSARFAHCGFKNCPGREAEAKEKGGDDQAAANKGVEQRGAELEQAVLRQENEAQLTLSFPEDEAFVDGGTSEEVLEPEPDPVELAIKHEANERLQALLNAEKKRREEMIRSALEQERSRGAGWQRLGNAEELSIVEERRRRIAERKQQAVAEEDSPDYLPAFRRGTTYPGSSPSAPVRRPGFDYPHNTGPQGSRAPRTGSSVIRQEGAPSGSSF